ncbi:MAG: NAD(P)(+) transhydrogenase (Re/Si-specific) subunit beta [Chloroflexaceae bacterium]|nr:NAD(P)(+) transhydrogenase (Re/Si-specific) subunit beta [Chloroflexaceae bacterium]
MMDILVNFAYIAAAVLFILGLKGLTHPRTAVRGNLLGAIGMLLAVAVTLLNERILSFEWVLAGLVVGAAVGSVLALRVPMTDMPQMVALLNGFGGLASVMVAGAALIEEQSTRYAIYAASASGIALVQMNVATVLSGFIGSVAFWGSLVAFGKLQGLLQDPPAIAHRQRINAVLLVLALLFGGWLVGMPEQTWLYWMVVLPASALGVLLVIGIGGADMPVVIALLNSYSGLAASATGFVLNNNALIITGALVGASGLILTSIMCRAMNRSLANVLFGRQSPADAAARVDDIYAGRVKSTTADELAMLLEGAGRVVVVPGFGMAVAQAQHAVRDLANLLEARGTQVEFGIHPVAGRMPGHMNVLLAEADIPYDKVKALDEINPTFEQADVAIVIGANDVVNPSARTDPASPIAGMPILDVDKARSVVVIKRSLSPGFTGVPNPLFAADKTLMFFADARKGLQDLVAALKAGGTL